jgi:anti-sigma regulatory factor (Ser/Thr protein kinase)/GAF domain-containing protein
VSSRPTVRHRSARIEDLVGLRSAQFRRKLALGLALGVVVVAVVASVVAWKLYVDAKARALTDLHARAVAAAAVLDQSFAGDVKTLEAVAAAPAIVDGHDRQVSLYLARAFPRPSAFTGGIGWIGRDGRLRASDLLPVPKLNLSDRLYVRRVLATGKPFISGGLIGRRDNDEILVVAVPTFDAHNRVTGLLAGSIVVKGPPESGQVVDLGLGSLEVIDRNGRMLLSGLGRVSNRPLLATMRHDRTGVKDGGQGLDGRGDHVVVWATVPQPHWLIAIDRPLSSVFAAARHGLELQLASIGVALVILFVLGLLLLRRTGRRGAQDDARRDAWARLTRRLGSASTPAEVGDVLLTTLADAFPDGIAVVAIASGDRLRADARSRTARLERTTADGALLDAVARLAARGPKSWPISGDPDLAALQGAGGRLQALHGLPIRSDSALLGTLALVTRAPELDQGDWALLESFADLAGQALQRAWRFAREHELAIRLQRSLLPGALPEIGGVGLDAHYLAGAAAVEVGGDWYDAVRRPDGVVELCVGDVSGRGIGAATVMGTQRSTFRAYAYECDSPAAIVQRMLRHLDGDSQMITVAAVAIDPFTAELSYARAGHPPPLLLDLGTGRVERLAGAGAPPLGVAETGDLVEEQIRLPDRCVLAMYTDGLIERRGLNMEEAIDVFADVLATGGDDAAQLVSLVAERLGEPDDDVALLVVAFDADKTRFEVELPADPSVLAGLRRRLRGWLSRRGFDEDEASEVLLAVSEACNNAVEHAYTDVHGLLRVTAEVESGGLEVVVEDRGRWRDVAPSRDRGRGLLLIKRLMDSAEFHSDHLGTRAVLRRRVPSERPTGDERVPAPVGTQGSA